MAPPREMLNECIIENLDDGAAILSPDGTIMICNQRCAEQLARPLDHLVGVQLAHFVSEHDKEKFNQLFQSGLNGKSHGEVACAVEEQVVNLQLSFSALKPRAIHGVFVKLKSVAQFKQVDALQTEEALRDSEHSLINLLPEGVSISALDGTILFASPRLVKMYGGETVEDAIGTNALDWVAPESREKAAAAIRAFASSDVPSANEYVLLKKDGSRFLGEITSAQFRDEQGNPKGLVSLHRDISERNHVEQALRESEKQLRESQVIARLGSYVLDIRTGSWKSSVELDLVFGIDESYEHTVGGWVALVHPEDRSMMERYFREKVIGERLPFDKEYRIVRPVDHVECWVHGLGTLESDAAGNLLTMRGTIQDITGRKRVEAKLQQLSAAVEQSPSSIVITDVSGNIEYVNPKFERVTGYALAEVIGQNPRILKSGNKTPEEYQQMWETVQSGQEWRGEFHNRKKNGELYWESASISPIIAPDGVITHFIAVKEDITQQKMFEEELRQTQKMQSIGTLAGGIAHDFNNILGIIIGHAGLLQENGRTKEKHQQSVSAIDTAARRGASLVKQILTFARKTEIRFELVRVNEIIKELAKLFEETFSKSITFVFDLERQLPLIDGDASQLHQTFLNLCVNARDAMPEGGTISIKTDTVNGQAVQELFPNATMDEYVRITLRDTGAGMSEEVRKRIYEPFFTTKELGKGTGLGLSVVYGIVNDHHGFIDVDSTVNQGTTFRVYFPVPGERRSSIATKDHNKSISQSKHETILLVEDEELLRSAIEIILTTNGYKVLTAKDGIEAIEVFKRGNGSIALVIMDFGMPRLSGLGALKEIQALNPQTKCIISSGYIDPNVRDEIHGLHSIEFLPKPYLEGEILALVRKVLDQNANDVTDTSEKG